MRITPASFMNYNLSAGDSKVRCLPLRSPAITFLYKELDVQAAARFFRVGMWIPLFPISHPIQIYREAGEGEHDQSSAHDNV